MRDFGSRHFQENLAVFSDPESTPEKYNLYKGLELMATDLQSLSAEMDGLRQQIAALSAK